MSTAEKLQLGRECYSRKAWAEARAHLVAADREGCLEGEDLERLASALYLVGRSTESAEVWARAHQEFLRRGEIDRAARCAFWLAFGLSHYGERARGSAWIARAGRLLEGRPECVEHGYLLLPSAFESLMRGDLNGSYEAFCRAEAIGERARDPDLVALARYSRGRVLLRRGEHREGIRLLDEAMLAIENHEVSSLVVGDVYCSVIEGCMEVFDLRRAQEWTAALARWCESQADLVPYSGQCLERRAEILTLHGAWPEAAEAARFACDRLLEPERQPAAGAAFYGRAEIQRLRGELAEAEESYREAGRHGRKPQPGLSLLRLAQGRVDDAVSAIRVAIEEAQGSASRARLLAASVEIHLAARKVPEARGAAEELERIASDYDAPFLLASAARARGAVLLAEGEGGRALAALREAWTMWREIDAPYEAAQVRLLMGLAYRLLGDRDGFEMELDAAHRVFQTLGARLDLARVEQLRSRDSRRDSAGLSPREIQVLRLVAAGKTNRTIAEELFISERTVERHLSNIFTKLDVSSRAGATAYAYEHRLL